MRRLSRWPCVRTYVCVRYVFIWFIWGAFELSTRTRINFDLHLVSVVCMYVHENVTTASNDRYSITTPFGRLAKPHWCCWSGQPSIRRIWWDFLYVTIHQIHSPKNDKMMRLVGLDMTTMYQLSSLSPSFANILDENKSNTQMSKWQHYNSCKHTDIWITVTDVPS